MLARTPLYELVDRTSIDQWRRTLLDGADFIEEKGLAKWTLVQHDGAVCARGAMIQLLPEEYFTSVRFIEKFRQSISVDVIGDHVAGVVGPDIVPYLENIRVVEIELELRLFLKALEDFPGKLSVPLSIDDDGSFPPSRD